MADEANVIDSAAPIAEPTIEITPEQAIKDLMNYSFGIEPEVNDNVVAASDAVIQTDAAPIEDVATVDKAETFDINTWAKNKFGVDNEEQLLTAWNELKTKATNTAEPQFANEQSKKIYEALLTGETKSVKQYLEAQEMLSGTETMSDDEKLKLYFKLQYSFNDKLAEDEFNENYNIDEDSFIDDSKLEREKLKLQQRKKNDVTKADEYFAQYKAKIELPKPTQIQPTVDESYEAYKASMSSAETTYNTVTVPKVNALKETDINFKVNVNDANNQMQFDVSIAPDEKDFAKAKQNALGIMNYITGICYDEAGNLHADKLARIVLLNDNFDKYAQSIARQAVNAERKRVIETEKTGGGSMRNYNVTGEKTELQKQMEFALS